MTAALVRGRCVAIAWPDARIPSRQALTVPDAPGTLTWRSGTFEDIRNHFRHGERDTANAVGVYAPPGFKSRSLRSSPSLPKIPGGRN